MYNAFASVYDKLMSDVPYSRWASAIEDIVGRYGARSRKTLELACGTGSLSIELAKRGFILSASDISEDMLAVAQEKSMECGARVRYVIQDMRTINFREKFDIVVSFCDGLNYILTADDLRDVFRGIYNVTNEDALLIFDISSDHKLRNVIGNRTIADVSEDVSFIWMNEFDEESSTLSFDITLFIEEEDGLYERHDEHHAQKAHTIEDVRTTLGDWFEVLSVLDTETLEEACGTSERLLFICKKWRK